MAYAVKELFYTLQGEGANTGRPAVFLRFTGCNLWSGREQDRSDAICRFCDTDFVGTDGEGGGRFATAAHLAEAVAARCPGQRIGNPLVVCTGGEPLLQLDEDLTSELHARGFEVAIETNGTLPVPGGVDWVCVSPKAGSELVVHRGNELKLVFPQDGADPSKFAGLPFDYHFLQPMDGLTRKQNTARAIEYCKDHPQWRLSTQTHKLLGIP